MVSSKETTPAAYLASLPPEHRKVIAAVRAVVKKRLPKGYVETMNWGMLSYEIPLSRYPDTYNKQPLMYIALAARKNQISPFLKARGRGPGPEEKTSPPPPQPPAPTATTLDKAIICQPPKAASDPLHPP